MTLITNIQNKTKDFSLTFFLIFTIIFFFSGCNSDNSNDKTSVVTKTENLVDETVSEDTDDSGVADVNGSFVDISDDTNTTLNPTLNTTQEDNTTQTIATVATDTNATQTTTTDTNSTTLITDPNTTTPKVVVINGHTLPPVPDKTLNDSTLLGIDSNNNGVRDDVERKIYIQYKRAIEQAYMMQYAVRYPKVLEDPVAAAASEELEKENWNMAVCRGYLRVYKKVPLGVQTVTFMENAYFNTKERMRAYVEFNEAMSGGVYHIPLLRDYKASSCDFNVTKMLELDI